MATRKPGRLLLIGGGDRRDPEYKVLKYFVEQAGGKKARILVIGAASDEPGDTLKEYRTLFKRFGATEVLTASLRERSEAETDEAVEQVEAVSAVFLTGGDQLRITTMLAGTRLGERLRERHTKGEIVVAGTSAGAAAIGSVMILGGPSDGTVRRSDVVLGAGLGYMRDSVIDTHFNERGRESRLLAVFAQNPQILGIGIDADTALDVHLGDKYEVVGNGVVIVFDGRVSFSNAARVREDQMLAVSGVQLHVLPEGYGFDPQKMEISTPYEEYDIEEAKAKS